MHRRRIAPLLVVLVALSAIGPVSAAEPSPTPPIVESSAPPVTPEPSTSPGPPTPPDPSASAGPSDEPSIAPGPPSAEPAESPSAAPSPAPSTGPAPAPATDAEGRPDTAGRYIVMLRGGSDTASVVTRVGQRDGVKADRTYGRTFRGFAAKLTAEQRRDVLADPSVLAVVPDEVIELTAQTTPTGVARVGGAGDPTEVNGSDTSAETIVDADVAIVDTGVSYHSDLNVAGGYNCSSSDRTAWRDKNDHGTHVAGTVAAMDNTFGVVGVAPGARIWAVKILNDDGYGLLSWYICGLDWILAQRDPVDPSRPLFEAVNMSVTKSGRDDGNCGLTNGDPLHQAICRVVDGGITVVAAAANDSHNAAYNIPASYNEVITVSALADTDGKPGGTGGNKCYSWGSYDKDDTFANFSNYGSDVDIIAPGKCILSTIPGPSYGYLSGTSMAAPTVTGAVALYKASRPNATPAEVREALRYLGNFGWATSTDPDSTHEPLLDVSRIAALGSFDVGAGTTSRVEAGTTGTIRIKVTRSSTFFERVRLYVTSLPSGWTGPAVSTSLLGWNATDGTLTVGVPDGTPNGTYQVGVKGMNQGRTETATISVQVVRDLPTAKAPTYGLIYGTQLGISTVPVRVAWAAATDPTSSIAGYEVQIRRGSGSFGGTIARSAGNREATYTIDQGVAHEFRVRARDSADNWGSWVTATPDAQVFPVDDRSGSITWKGSWSRRSYQYAFAGTISSSRQTGASARMTFTGHGISVIAPRNSSLGILDVYVDGKYVKHLYLSTSKGASRQVVFTRTFASGGTHTIEVRNHGGSKAVDFDAFVVSK